MKAARNTTNVLFTRQLRIHDHPALAAAVRAAEQALGAWKAGRTEHPPVDAAMRQLATEGWRPNRARLVTAAVLWGSHTPWRIDARARARLDYLAPVVDPTRCDAARRVRGTA
jgi:deoxyribodipyrimidine photolyase